MFARGNAIVSVKPAVEPIPLELAKQHLKMDEIDEDDTLINGLIAAARSHVEQYCNCALISQTITEKFSGFGAGGLVLSIAPVIEVSGVQYLDGAGELQPLGDDVYRVNNFTRPASVYIKYGKTFPNTWHEPNAVTCVYTAGYGEASGDVPEPIRQAMLLLIGDMYYKRNDSVKKLPTAAEYLLAPYRFNRF